MRRNTIKWRIFKYNLAVIILLISLTTIIFNVTVRLYIERDILKQLNKIASHTEDTALRRGPDFFPAPDGIHPPPPPINENDRHNDDNELLRFYFMLDRSLRETLSVLNADYILLDSDKNRIIPSEEEYFKISGDMLNKITTEVAKLNNSDNETYLNFDLSGTKYVAIIKPVSQKNSFGLGWIIIFSSLQKVIQLQWGLNTILFAILILSSLILVAFSSLTAKKISAPFSSLNNHIRAIAERNFGNKIHVPVVDELQEFVNNINIMSEKLETYDKAQKTFLQNASHEFRTPLMSIQSYAEGIKYNVIDNNSAVEIIIDETKRLTHLVEDLLYLSRLDTIEENYNYNNLYFNNLITSCIERMNGIAIKHNIQITSAVYVDNDLKIYADEEKLSRALMNILSNCIKYAESIISINSKIVDSKIVELTISDDGSGFDTNDLPNLFERFYIGKKGDFGLGLAISKNVIEKHNGKISAENSDTGALFKVELPI